jgi:hypothetical protein
MHVLIEVWFILKASICDRVGLYCRLVFTRSMLVFPFKRKVFQHVRINAGYWITVIPGSELSTLQVGPSRPGKKTYTLVEIWGLRWEMF